MSGRKYLHYEFNKEELKGKDDEVLETIKQDYNKKNLIRNYFKGIK